jgi:hypothetical protein
MSATVRVTDHPAETYTWTDKAKRKVDITAPTLLECMEAVVEWGKDHPKEFERIHMSGTGPHIWRNSENEWGWSGAVEIFG